MEAPKTESGSDNAPVGLWAEHKKTIISTAIVVIVAGLVIKFFDWIFLALVVSAIAVGAVIAWKSLVKKHGSPTGVWKAFTKELGLE